ncbi:hypothetical protein [Chryseobacterium indoltheticum]|uniref:hypothetical protein n=1 Tax=Chryseobacterium indoltheticum TaxID=254 RepID=UPI003F496B09
MKIKNTAPEIFFRDGGKKVFLIRRRGLCKSINIEKAKLLVALNSFLEQDFKENLVSASCLPKGWCWYDYDDGSGSLKSPNGNNYYSYDLQTQEYKLPTLHNRWTNMKAFLNNLKV